MDIPWSLNPLIRHIVLHEYNVDNTTIYVIGTNVDNISSSLSNALSDCQEWMHKNKLRLNLQKTKCMLLHPPQKSPPPLTVKLNNLSVEQVPNFTFLGCVINERLTWDDHIQHITTKATRNINLLQHLSWFLPRKILVKFYEAYILPRTTNWRLMSIYLDNYSCHLLPNNCNISPSWASSGNCT